MGGQNAIRGYEYQFLRTLEYALRALIDKDASATGIYVESPPAREQGEDCDVVDFALYRDDEALIKAQVKSGKNATMSGIQALAIFLRLITGESRQYLVLTNRQPGTNLEQLSSLLADQAQSMADFQDGLLTISRRSTAVTEELQALENNDWDRLRRCRVGTDDRSDIDIRHKLRELVRSLRRHQNKGAPGWDAAGLLLGHLLWNVLATAASVGRPLISLDALREQFALDNATIASAVSGQAWAIDVNTPPMLTDISRPDLIDLVGSYLTIPNPTAQVPACVLFGLSGIGKTSIAAAWSNDRRDDYSAIFWVDGSSDSSIEASFIAVEQWICQTLGEKLPQPRLIDRVQVGLSRLTRPWLLVLDNVSDSSTAKRWLPRNGHGHVIVTTTDASSWHGSAISRVEVLPMSQKQAQELMFRRLRAGDFRFTDDTSSSIANLVDRLQRWPLAIELASAYLVDCQESIAGFAHYERLILRALGDERSIPPGYPRTLVGAVLFAIHQMHRRGESDDAAKAARMSLRFAAYMHPRQIPLHMLMACVWVDFETAMRDDVASFTPYTLDKPPIGEITRELFRGSLVTRDYPIFGGVDKEETARSFDFSISMNEIVQQVLRADIAAEGLMEGVVAQVSYFAQRWLKTLLDSERFDLAAILLGHCRAIADESIKEGVSNYLTALLWGNTAIALALAEDWNQAEVYLRAEVNFFETSDVVDPLMPLATYIQLAQALTRKSDNPSRIASEVCHLLNRVADCYPKAQQSNANAAALSLINALTLANELRQELPNNLAVRAVFDRFQQLVVFIEELDDKAAVANQMLELNRRLIRGDPTANAVKIRELLGDPKYSFQYITLKRFLLETEIQLGEWEAALAVLAELVIIARKAPLGYVDVSSIITNTTLASVTIALAGVSQAFSLVAGVADFAEAFRSHGENLRPSDESWLQICHAVLAARAMKLDTAQQMINAATFGDFIPPAEGKVFSVRDLHALVKGWVDAQTVSRSEVATEDDRP